MPRPRTRLLSTGVAVLMFAALTACGGTENGSSADATGTARADAEATASQPPTAEPAQASGTNAGGAPDWGNFAYPVLKPDVAGDCFNTPVTLTGGHGTTDEGHPVRLVEAITADIDDQGGPEALVSLYCESGGVNGDEAELAVLRDAGATGWVPVYVTSWADETMNVSVGQALGNHAIEGPDSVSWVAPAGPIKVTSASAGALTVTQDSKAVDGYTPSPFTPDELLTGTKELTLTYTGQGNLVAGPPKALTPTGIPTDLTAPGGGEMDLDVSLTPGG